MQFAEKADVKNAIDLVKAAAWGKETLQDHIIDIPYKGQNKHCDNLDNDVGAGKGHSNVHLSVPLCMFVCVCMCVCVSVCVCV